MSIVIDCDSHFSAPKPYADKEAKRRFRGRWPFTMTNKRGRSVTVFPEGDRLLTPLQRSFGGSHMFGGGFPGLVQNPKAVYDPAARVEWLDAHGIDMQVLVPGGVIKYALEPEIAAAICRSYNDATARVLEQHPGRYIGLAVLPMQDTAAAMDELERAVGELGIHAPIIISNVNGRNLTEYEYWPIYERIEEMGVPLIVHGSRMESPGPIGMEERMRSMHLDNVLGFLFEGSLTVTNFILHGVFDMFPKLRVGLLETGAGWITYLMDLLNELYETEVVGGVSPAPHIPIKDVIEKRPEEYMNQIWLCFNVAAEGRNIPHVVETLGASQFMTNTDFPHILGGGGGGMVELAKDLPLTDAQKDQLLGLSAAALYGIDPVTHKQVRSSQGAAEASRSR